jgi:hypothetical protein
LAGMTIPPSRALTAAVAELVMAVGSTNAGVQALAKWH